MILRRPRLYGWWPGLADVIAIIAVGSAVVAIRPTRGNSLVAGQSVRNTGKGNIPAPILRKIRSLIETRADGIPESDLIHAYNERYHENLTAVLRKRGAESDADILQRMTSGINRRPDSDGQIRLYASEFKPRKRSKKEILETRQAAQAAGKLLDAIQTSSFTPPLRIRTAPSSRARLKLVQNESNQRDDEEMAEITSELEQKSGMDTTSGPVKLDQSWKNGWRDSSELSDEEKQSDAGIASNNTVGEPDLPTAAHNFSTASQNSPNTSRIEACKDPQLMTEVKDVLAEDPGQIELKFFVDGGGIERDAWKLTRDASDVIQTASRALAHAFTSAVQAKTLIPIALDDARSMRSELSQGAWLLLSRVLEHNWQGALFTYSISDLDRLWTFALPQFLQAFVQPIIQRGVQEIAQLMKECTKKLWLLFHFVLAPGQQLRVPVGPRAPGPHAEGSVSCPSIHWIASDFISLPFGEARTQRLLLSRCSLEELVKAEATSTTPCGNGNDRMRWLQLQHEAWRLNQDFWKMSDTVNAIQAKNITSEAKPDLHGPKVKQQDADSVPVEGVVSRNPMQGTVRRNLDQNIHSNQSRAAVITVTQEQNKSLSEINVHERTRQGGVERTLSTSFAPKKLVDGDFVGLPSRDQRIVVDGCNVAWYYSGSTKFCTEGLAICLEWFLARGYQKIFAFVPQSYAQAPSNSSYRTRVADDLKKLLELKSRGLVQFTPAGSDDDAFIIQYAFNSDGYIVSNDNYREFKRAAQEEWMEDWLNRRKIFYTFVNGEFIPTGSKILRKKDAAGPAQPGPPPLVEHAESPIGEYDLQTQQRLPAGPSAVEYHEQAAGQDLHGYGQDALDTAQACNAAAAITREELDFYYDGGGRSDAQVGLDLGPTVGTENAGAPGPGGDGLNSMDVSGHAIMEQVLYLRSEVAEIKHMLTLKT